MLGPNAYKTFQATSPKRTHWRKAKSCEEVGCANWSNGWTMVIYPDTPEGKQHLAVFEPHKTEFNYTTEKSPGNGLKYIFAAGQNCFELPNHEVRLPYPERYFIRQGDARQFGRTIELNPEDFQGEMNLNNEAYNRRLEG